MEDCVVDASATLPWCFKDESTTWTERLLHDLGEGRRVVVPAHWPTEISNGLLMAERKQRILLGKAELFWDELSLFQIELQAPMTFQQAKTTLTYSRKHRLTIYDAAYLELAVRRGLAMATLDEALRRACIGEYVDLV